jgi:aminotransferase
MTVECARLGGINLAQGICDTDVPEAVRRAAAEAIEAGSNMYARAEGLLELRLALAAKMRRDGALAYDAESEILVTNGATGAFFVAAQALLDPGDEVIAFEPYYGYHTNTLAALGVGVRFVTLEPPDWEFARDSLEGACTARTRGIVVNTPCNPAGKVFTRVELEQIGELARERDLFIFTDEVYEHFVFDGIAHLSPAALPGLREHVILINALSKTFAITGWRIGWVAADARFTRPMAALNDLFYVCAPTPLQLACARGLERLPAGYYTGIGAEFQRKRDLLCAALGRAGLPPHRPAGTYFTMADIGRLPGETGVERALWLLREAGIACVPGSAFYRGEVGERVARFCFGKTDADLEEACRRLEKLGTGI